ncbi:DUF1499 domain-containing protein [Cetobacterium somerae]|uniref:DUF1499 domain-containing protein n=1 Tax=Cetobacterium somerae TaxID=188913 RepID=UPI003D769AEA
MLEECPKSPNCVSSFSQNKSHYIKPIEIVGNVNEAREKLIQILKNLHGEILQENKDYIKVAFYSKFFKFEDIAEFQIDSNKKIINVRSAAQTGWYDFGVNRKRIEKIRQELN